MEIIACGEAREEGTTARVERAAGVDPPRPGGQGVAQGGRQNGLHQVHPALSKSDQIIGKHECNDSEIVDPNIIMQ